MKYLNDLMFWAAERERIRLKREAGEQAPWTSDPVLATYRFCNVRREDDKVTKWIHNNWLRSADATPKNIPFAMAVARMVNWPGTLAELGYPSVWDRAHFERVLASRKARGEKVWTNAYMITGGYSAGGESKEVIIGRVLDGLYGELGRSPIVEGDSLETAANKLTVPGIGSFLTAQIVADVKWSKLLRDAKDWFYWCAPGPGSTMGLNFMHDRPLNTSLSQIAFQAEVNEVRELLNKGGYPDLCAQNTQNCLCELSKYIRAKHFGARLKNKYGPSAF